MTDTGTQLVPDVCDIVEFGLDSYGKAPATYRVDGWLKPYVEPYRVTGYDMLLTGAMRSELDNKQRSEVLLQPVLQAIAAEKEAMQPRRSRLVWCGRGDATHLALSGIGGAVAPVAECKVIGRVNWSAKTIQQQIDQANFLAKEGGLTDCYR